ncbi:MAG: hypothetical protein KDD82_17420 [Planctomycetes bacterium]|nr:hypothetical protein [Planctomycetota bacterium]
MEQIPSHSGTVRPLGVLVLLVFLTTDGLERAIEVALNLTLSEEELAQKLRVFDTPALVSCFWIGADWLLALLLGLRSWAGRLWTQSLFGIHLFYLYHMVALRAPEGWLYLDPASRTQIALTVVLDVGAIAYLSSTRAKDYLCN